MNYFSKLNEITNSVKELADFSPKIAIVLGSGLGNFAKKIKEVSKVKYSDIKGFPQSTVEGHSGQFIFGHIDDVPVVAMQGRVHFYEGYPMQDVVLPIRVMGLLGAEVLFLSNAAGGINSRFNPGTLMLIRDHIAMFVDSPLTGQNINELGVRFPDMSNIYNNELCDIIKSSAKSLNIPLEEGVYLQATGPQYESPAEIKMASIVGADAVGMSTACEAITANHMGIKVCGISCITNLAAGISTTPLNHAEVQEVANKVANNFENLVKDSIIEIYKTL